jgi:oxygen-dependent protoporphyrinogen oxidase
VGARDAGGQGGVMAKVVVVGAGIAGLGAAYSMHKAGVDVSVLEATPHVGGRMRSTEWNGAWIDLGAEFIATPGIDEMLFHELGIMKDRLEYPGGDVSFDIWRDGHAHRFSYTDPRGILRFTGLSTWEKLRMAAMLPAYARMWRELRGRYFEPWRGAWADDESIETWLGRVSPAFLEYVVEPMFELYCGWEPDNFSKGAFLATAFLPRLPTIWTFRQGLGTVTGALAARVDVATNARVTRIDLERSPVVVEWEEAGAMKSTTADAVLVAVPGNRVLDFTRGLTPEREHFFEQVQYVPHELPFFTVTEPPAGVPDGVFFPRREDSQIAAIGYHVSSTNPDVKFLRVSMKTSHIVGQLGNSDDEDLDAIIEKAARRYPSVRSVIKDRFISRWRDALPAFPAGSMQRLRDFVALPPQPGVAFAGDYLYTGATTAAYQTGQWAAADLLTRYA